MNYYIEIDELLKWKAYVEHYEITHNDLASIANGTAVPIVDRPGHVLNCADHKLVYSIETIVCYATKQIYQIRRLRCARLTQGYAPDKNFIRIVCEKLEFDINRCKSRLYVNQLTPYAHIIEIIRAISFKEVMGLP